jgi:hypothetical protein
MRIPLVLVCGVVVSYCVPASAADDCGPGVDYYDVGYSRGERFASGLWDSGGYVCSEADLAAFRAELDANLREPNPVIPCANEGYNQALDDYYDQMWWSCRDETQCRQMGSEVAGVIADLFCQGAFPPLPSIEEILCRTYAELQCKDDVEDMVNDMIASGQCGPPRTLTPEERLALLNWCEEIIWAD